MVRGKQGHASCRTSSSKNHLNGGSQLWWAQTSGKVGGWHLSKIKRQVQARILEYAGLA